MENARPLASSCFPRGGHRVSARADGAHGCRPNTSSGTEHPQVEVHVDSRVVLVDEMLAPLIIALWAAGIATVYSCQSAPVPPDGWRDASGEERIQLVLPDVEELRHLLYIVEPDDELMCAAFRYGDTPRWEYSLAPQRTSARLETWIDPPVRIQVAIYIPVTQLAGLQRAIDRVSARADGAS